MPYQYTTEYTTRYYNTFSGSVTLPLEAAITQRMSIKKNKESQDTEKVKVYVPIAKDNE